MESGEGKKKEAKNMKIKCFIKQKCEYKLKKRTQDECGRKAALKGKIINE